MPNMPTMDTMTMGLTKRVLLYGAPKSGKSQLAGQLAHNHKLLWFDLENGSDVLYKLPPEAQKNVALVRIPDSYDNPVAIDTMAKLLKGVSAPVCMTHGKLRCAVCARTEGAVQIDIDMAAQRASNHRIVVIDSLTQLRISAMTHISGMKGASAKIDAARKAGDIKFNYDDWAMLNGLIEMCLSEVQAASYDIVVISHEVEVENVDGTNQIVPISSTRNGSRNTAKYFSDVVHLDVVNRKHVASSSTTAKPKILTGSRTDVVLEGMAQASLEPFFTHRQPVSK